MPENVKEQVQGGLWVALRESSTIPVSYRGRDHDDDFGDSHALKENEEGRHHHDLDFDIKKTNGNSTTPVQGRRMITEIKVIMPDQNRPLQDAVYMKR